MILNLIHRPAYGEHYRLFRLQQDMAHELGLKVTLLLDPRALRDEEMLRVAREDARKYGDELGIWFAGFEGPDFEKDLTGKEQFVWLFSEPEKRRIFEIAFGLFREVFGHDPVSIGSYHFDAGCLRLIRELCPAVKIAVAGCFEEGVKVFHGCNNSWYLFNEGMPWMSWYPSKSHALRAATDESDWSGIIGVPHLSRDLVLSYEGRNDFFATHPANVQRAMAYRAGDCPYMFNLVDQQRLQEQYNDGFSHCNVHVSASWLVPNHNVPDPEAVSAGLYRDFLEYFVSLRREGCCRDMTMGEFAVWYRKAMPVGKPHMALAKEMLYGTGKHYFWYVDGYFRVLIDATQGGSIGDLRPYAGQVPVETGPDSPQTIYGSYPYLIHSQYRSGLAHHFEDGARTTLIAICNGEEVDLGTCPTKVASVEKGVEGTCVRLTPAEVTFRSGVRASIETEFQFVGNGDIRIVRRLVGTSDPGVEIRVREYVKGCYGTTEYPEDMKGIRLSVDGSIPAELAYAYKGRTLATGTAKSARAEIPQVGTKLVLEAEGDPALHGQAIEGFLFNPYYTLTLEKPLTKQKEITTWLRVKKLL